MPATVWLFNVGPFCPPPTNPNPSVSSPYLAFCAYPRFASSPTPSPLIPYSPWLFQLVDEFGANKPPRELAQFAGSGFAACVVQPSGNTTKVSGEFVETSTRTSCAGEPTLNANEDHCPSSPSPTANVSGGNGRSHSARTED